MNNALSQEILPINEKVYLSKSKRVLAESKKAYLAKNKSSCRILSIKLITIQERKKVDKQSNFYLLKYQSFWNFWSFEANICFWTYVLKKNVKQC